LRHAIDPIRRTHAMTMTRHRFLRAAAAALATLPLSRLLAEGEAAPAAGWDRKSAKRGVAYDLASEADAATLAPGVSWWYGGELAPNPGAPADAPSRHEMSFVPAIRGARFDDARVLAWLKAHPQVEHLLVLDEPDTAAGCTPQQAAALWPRCEAITSRAGVQLVGPAIGRGTAPGFEDPVAWLDAFFAAYRAANRGRDPWIDAIAFHWRDDGLGAQLDRLAKYGKPFWVTAMAGPRESAGGPQADAAPRQLARMADLVATCEARADVQRYAWLTGRSDAQAPSGSLLAGDGSLTPLGRAYLGQPFA
jgi:hypothetical protein